MVRTAGARPRVGLLVGYLFAGALVVGQIAPASGREGLADLSFGAVLDVPGVLLPPELSTARCPCRLALPASGGPIVYLVEGEASVVRAGAVRIGGGERHADGSVVGAGDADVGQSVTVLDGRLVFDDVDGDGVFGEPDGLLLDVSGDSRADAGDLVLRPSVNDPDRRPGRPLTTTGPSLASYRGVPLRTHPGHVAFLSTRGTGVYTPGDALVVTAGPRSLLTPGSLALTRVGSSAPGSLLEPADVLRPATLVRAGAPGQVAHLGHHAGHEPNSSESVLIGLGTDRVELGSVWLADPPAGAFVGAVVGPGDPLLGTPMGALAGRWQFLDADGDGRFGPGDTLGFDVFDLSTPNAEDIVASGPDAGRRVGPNASILGLPAQPYPGVFGFLDLDENARLGGAGRPRRGLRFGRHPRVGGCPALGSF